MKLDFEYCHKDIVGKILRKASDLILMVFGRTSFLLQLLNGLHKIVEKKDKIDSRIKYLYYLLSRGNFKSNYISFLANNEILKATQEKEKWARFICSFSESEYEIKSAQDYLYLLDKYELVQKSKANFNFNILPGNQKLTDNSFYLFGPNADHEPNQKYLDKTIVLSKDVNFDISRFNNSIMFLNWIYYQTKVRTDTQKRKMILDKYGEVFVSSLYPIDDQEIPLSEMPISSTLGGAQGLGRALYHLVTKNGRCNCVIDGYDFWIKKETFSDYYPTLNRVDGKIVEKNIVNGLADHDAIYNFLFVKEMLNHIDVIDSAEFLDYVNLSVEEYIDRLIKQRNFKLLIN